MSEVQQEQTLKRGLKNRHIQLIALGGAVGTGLFLGKATTIQMAGPSVLLGHSAILPINTGVVLPVFYPAGTTGQCLFWWAWRN